MKINSKYVLALLCILLSAPMVEAQFRNGGMNGRRRGAVPQAQEPPKEAKPLTAEEIVENEMPKITKALELNDFEQAVVSSVLTRHVQQTIELRLLELSPEKTREGMEKIKKSQDDELKAGLPEDKYEAFLELQKNGFKKKKKKKKKSKT